MGILLSLLLFWLFPLTIHADNPNKPDKKTSSLYGALSRGDEMSWDQLEVVAKDVGIRGERLQELKIKNRALELIQRYRLALEVSGFSNGMMQEEEFRLYKGSKPGWGKIEFNSDFWEKNPALGDSDAFLTYLLFRAQAYYVYRSRYDPEHCTWIVREESEPLESSFSILRAALNTSAALPESHAPFTVREIEFRRSLDPTQDKVRTLRKLIEFSLQCIAQKAADNWAIRTYRSRVGNPSSLIMDKLRARERILAWDLERARSSMTLAERMTFRRLLKTPFRYAAEQAR